jgi:hypothetical protein
MVKPSRVWLGGVKTGAMPGAESWILSSDGFVLMTFFIFWAPNGLATTLHLPSQVLEDPTLGPFDEVSPDSAFGVLGRDEDSKNRHLTLEARYGRREAI